MVHSVRPYDQAAGAEVLARRALIDQVLADADLPRPLTAAGVDVAGAVLHRNEHETADAEVLGATVVAATLDEYGLGAPDDPRVTAAAERIRGILAGEASP